MISMETILYYTNIFAYYIVDYLIYQQPNMHHCTDITTWVTKWSFPKMGLPLNHPFWEDSIINVCKPSSCWVFSWAKPGRCVFRPKRKLWAWKAPPLCVLVDHVDRPCEKNDRWLSYPLGGFNKWGYANSLMVYSAKSGNNSLLNRDNPKKWDEWTGLRMIPTFSIWWILINHYPIMEEKTNTINWDSDRDRDIIYQLIFN